MGGNALHTFSEADRIHLEHGREQRNSEPLIVEEVSQFPLLPTLRAG